MSKFKAAVIRAVEIVNGFGFSLIVGSVIYFIIGSIAGLVGGEMLDWTFCGSVRHIFDVNWCGIEGHTGENGLDMFVHKLFNVTLPWFMMFWGFVLTGVSSLLLKLLGFQYRPPGAKADHEV